MPKPSSALRVAENVRPRPNVERLQKTIRGEANDSPPIWIMGQAGRYLEELRSLQELHGISSVYQTPDLAARATLIPIEKFDVDAAIIYNDILAIPQALGIGSVFSTPLTIENMDAILNADNIRERLGNVVEAIRETKEVMQTSRLPNLPLFGFSAAPWTLMAYMIEGGRSRKTCSQAKKWLNHKQLNLLTNTIIEYLKMQIDAGADILQIFD